MRFQPARQVHGTLMLRDLLRRRLVEPILRLLRQGITPQKIALSFAIASGLGSLRLGLPTNLCTAVALSLRLNLAAIQLVKYLAAPLQLPLILHSCAWVNTSSTQRRSRRPSVTPWRYSPPERAMP